MKTLISVLVCFWALTGWSATNDWRVVDGKVYNASYSTNWKSLYVWMSDKGHSIYQVKAVAFLDDGILCYVTELAGNPMRGQQVREVLYKQIMLVNHPRADSLTVGDVIDCFKVKVMRVKPVMHMEAYDYGIPARTR